MITGSTWILVLHYVLIANTFENTRRRVCQVIEPLLKIKNESKFSKCDRFNPFMTEAVIIYDSGLRYERVKWAPEVSVT